MSEQFIALLNMNIPYQEAYEMLGGSTADLDTKKSYSVFRMFESYERRLIRLSKLTQWLEKNNKISEDLLKCYILRQGLSRNSEYSVAIINAVLETNVVYTDEFVDWLLPEISPASPRCDMLGKNKRCWPLKWIKYRKSPPNIEAQKLFAEQFPWSIGELRFELDLEAIKVAIFQDRAVYSRLPQKYRTREMYHLHVRTWIN